ncbi:AAA family ATPase [Shewanella algae]|uniref:AAA family ATPase n=1 Tax=Shewanella algae TaxID=38313 RepID=UPI001AADF6F5|nr:AAA family ATPase [Shewanella algae]QTE94942.1 AAA family ATPase [Shewanella algae]
MELAYLYIQEHKALKDIDIPINGSHKCHYSNELLTVKFTPNNLDYYQGLACSAIIGKNGVGKSTILDFIEAAHAGTDSSGMIVWFDNITSNYHICLVNMYLNTSSVLSDHDFVFEEDLSRFVHQHKIKLVKANNLTGVEANDFSIKRKANSFIYDMSLSQYANGSKRAVAQRTNRLIRYFNSRASFKNAEQPKIQFTFQFNSSSTAYLNSLLKDEGFTSKYIDSSDDLDLLKSQLDISLNIIDLHEYKNIASQLLRTNLLSICNYLSKTSVVKKTHQKAFFIKCLIKILKGDFDIKQINEILLNLRKEDEFTSSELILNADSLIIFNKYAEILNDFGVISRIQHSYINEYKIHSPNEVSSFNAEFIIDLTSQISNLPAMLANNFPYGWNGFSTGEFAKLNIFSELYTYIHNEKNCGIKNHLIVMDEVDLYLHPDWQRTFLSELLDFINVEFPDNSVQLILSTHSPIIISDFLPEDIVSLDKNNGNTEIVESFGFGSHITDLYVDGMHLKSTFGEHSKKAINHLLNRANEGTLTKQDIGLVKKIKSKNVQQMILGTHDKN